MCVYAQSLQSCLTLFDPMDCSPPGSSVHGILPARILEWVAMPSSRGSSHSGIEPLSPALQADSLLLNHRGSPSKDAYVLLFNTTIFSQIREVPARGLGVTIAL